MPRGREALGQIALTLGQVLPIPIHHKEDGNGEKDQQERDRHDRTRSGYTCVTYITHQEIDRDQISVWGGSFHTTALVITSPNTPIMSHVHTPRRPISIPPDILHAPKRTVVYAKRKHERDPGIDDEDGDDGFKCHRRLQLGSTTQSLADSITNVQSEKDDSMTNVIDDTNKWSYSIPLTAIRPRVMAARCAPPQDGDGCVDECG